MQPIPTAAVHRLVDSIKPGTARSSTRPRGLHEARRVLRSHARQSRSRARRIVIDRQLVQLTGRTPHLRPPKTPASYRTIPLLIWWQGPSTAQVRDYGGPAPPSTSRAREVSGVIFTGTADVPVRRSSFGDVWRPAVKRAGLALGTRFHELRHYYASVLIEAGESVKVIQARLGHKSAVETLDTYGPSLARYRGADPSAIDLALGAIEPILTTLDR